MPSLSHQLPQKKFCGKLRTYLPSYAVPVRRAAHQPLFLCGTKDNNAYLIEKGSVKTTMLCRNGKECLLDISTEGDIVGESCLLCPDRYDTAMAMTLSVFRVIPRAQLIEIIVNNGLLEDSLRYLTAKLSEQQHIITEFVTSDSERRLAAALLRLARKLGKRHNGRLNIGEKITQEELAGIVGTTRSRVGYFLKRFRDAGLIEASTYSPLVINEDLLDRYVDT